MSQAGGRAMGGLAVLLGVTLIGGGLTKLAGEPHQVASFAMWGLPGWFRLLVGSFEVLGGIALVVPGWRPVGSLVLATIMVGALWTHAAMGEWLHLFPAGVLLVLLLLIFRSNKRQAIRLLGGV